MSHRFPRALVAVTLVILAATAPSSAGDGNRLTYLDEDNPWYPHKDFPKLTTPQWVGENGVEAVVILAIDDMRDTKKYEAYLRPILNRLKKIDGRAPVSIMSCKVKPKDPRLQSWLDEGLSIECHTVDHPCPLLAGGDFKKAASTYHRCVDLMNQIPRNKPVAFRTPCCDSLNTVSPRFYAEIFNRTSKKGNFLQIDSSVFNVFTSADKSIPRHLVLEKDGGERFKKYLPRKLKRRGVMHNTFVNTIENYPYPYVIGNTCWQFPCVAPSDWSAQHFHGKNNHKTVADWKAALDITVKKKGVFCLVFHPHGWIKAEQVVELIDHAVKTHGKKVKFLNFREAASRLKKNLHRREALGPYGFDSGIRFMDVNNDGFIDVVLGGLIGFGNDYIGAKPVCRIWSNKSRTWRDVKFPVALSVNLAHNLAPVGARFGILKRSGDASLLISDRSGTNKNPDEWTGFWNHEGTRWKQSLGMLNGLTRGKSIQLPGEGEGIRLRNLDGDGVCEIVVGRPAYDTFGERRAIFAVYQFNVKLRKWSKLPFRLPEGTSIVATKRKAGPSYPDAGLRFVDINGDGRDDIVFSNHERYGVWLFKDMKSGWSVEVLNVKRGAAKPRAAEVVLPPIVRKDGTNNGFFVHSRHLFWQNEETDKLPDLVYRVSFDELLKNVKPQPKSPEMSLKAMQPRPGFMVELVAAEPLVRDPVAFEWGPDGRLWVAEMADYPVGRIVKPSAKSKRKDGRIDNPSCGKGGRVRFLTDTDGDGKYDKSTLFLDGLNFPTGVLPWRKGVLITAAPDILYAEDTNGDGKADVTRVLFTGFGEGNQQHRVNGLVYGLDNWVYCANGDSDGRINSTKTGKVVDIRGRDFRFNPDTGELQTVTGRTQFGRNRDAWGNWFGCNNSNPMYHFVLSERYLARNLHVRYPDPRVHVSVQPGAAPVFPVSRAMPRFNDYNKLNRFTSACSAMIYGDALFGPEYVGNSFVSEPVHNLVHREIVAKTGVSFTSRRPKDEQKSEFLASRDNWFRPTMIKTGPDGALYVADMYRLVIEHPQYIPKELQKNWDFRAGEKLGRIYRVFPDGKRLPPVPRLDTMTTAQLVGSLNSPNGWVRDTAQRLIVLRNDKSAVPLLQKTATGRGRQAAARLHALCTLDGLGALKPSLITAALVARHAVIRRHAVRLAEGRLDSSSELDASVARLAGDPEPLVRMQVAYSLGESRSGQSARALADLILNNADDRYLTAAAMSSLNRSNIEAVVTRLFGRAGLNAVQTAARRSVLRVAPVLGGEKVILAALEQVTRPGGNRSQRIAELASFAELLDGLATARRSLKGVLNKAQRTRKKMLTERVNRTQRYAIKVIYDTSQQRRVSDRVTAMRLLPHLAEYEGNVSNVVKGCRELLVPQEPLQMQSAVVSALARIGDDSVPDLLLAGWRSHGPSLRREIVAALLGRERWSRDLLSAVGKGTVRVSEISAAHRQRLLASRSRDVRRLAATVLRTSAIDANRKKVVESYAAALKLTGNPARGKAVFKKSCAACHRLDGVGKTVGPDLTALKDKSPRALLVAMLDPNRNVESKYVGYVAVTNRGRTYAGLLASEAGGSITLIGTDGKSHVLLRNELEALRSTAKSAMPEGLEKDLKPQDVADVTAYVIAAKSAVKSVRPNGRFPRTIRPGKDGTFTLAADNCEIYGPTLKLEKRHNNLGWWGSADDRAVWPIYVPAEATYSVEMDLACDNMNAGNFVRMDCGRGRLSAKVPSTGTWERYVTRKVGTIKLPAGQQRLTVRAGGSLRGYLMDLKAVRLKPLR
ncbi:MAG: PVC-type heme-binding CxxCH protein [Planctomycetaceae bacterium]